MVKLFPATYQPTQPSAELARIRQSIPTLTVPIYEPIIISEKVNLNGFIANLRYRIQNVWLYSVGAEDIALRGISLIIQLQYEIADELYYPCFISHSK